MSTAAQPQRGRFIRGRTEETAMEQESAHKKARKCLTTPADIYVDTQSFASTTAQPQREDSAQRRAEDIARECLMTPADFYAGTQNLASATAQPQREDLAQRRAEDLAPGRQPSSAETSPCSKEVESVFFPQSVNPRPTGVQGSAFQPVQPRNPPRGASGGRSPPADSKGLNNKHKCLRQMQRNLSEEDSYEGGQKKQQWNKKVHTKKQGNL